jgi:hypothetical protein
MIGILAACQKYAQGVVSTSPGFFVNHLKKENNGI